MRQIHEILKNRFFTSSSVNSIVSNLQYDSNYYVNTTGESIEIVDSSNIRGFLNNEKNQSIVQAYYIYLTSSTLMNSSILSSEFIPTSSFKAIFYDDEKLADSFNSFYNQVALKGNLYNPLDSQKNVIINQLNYDKTEYNVLNNYFYWKNPAYSPKKNLSAVTLDIYNGDRNFLPEKRFVQENVEESYYISVFLTKEYEQISRKVFDVCDNFIYNISGNKINFSQDVSDVIKYNDYLQIISKSSNDDQILVKTINEQSKDDTINQNLIQCFVNPNFKLNENEFWSDSKFVSSKI
jgi:hypothetical protein